MAQLRLMQPAQLPEIKPLDLAGSYQKGRNQYQTNKLAEGRLALQDKSMQMQDMQMSEYQENKPAREMAKKMKQTQDALAMSEEYTGLVMKELMNLDPESPTFDQDILETIKAKTQMAIQLNADPEVMHNIEETNIKMGVYTPEFVRKKQAELKGKQESFTLAGGSKRYDATGNMIAENKKDEGLTEYESKSVIGKLQQDQASLDQDDPEYKKKWDELQDGIEKAREKTKPISVSAKATSSNKGQGGLNKLADEQAKTVTDGYDAAREAVQSLETSTEARSLLADGMITGWGAEWIMSGGKLLQQVGFKANEDEIANTEAYKALMGKEVGRIIKLFGSGTGLSDADREYAAMIVGGNVTITHKGLLKIIEINDRANNKIIKDHNRINDKIWDKEGAQDTLLFNMHVDLPKEYKTPQPPAPESPPGAAFKGFDEKKKVWVFWDKDKNVIPYE